MSGEKKTTLNCSFCGKTQNDVRKLIAGPSVYICDECVELCGDILDEELRSVVGADDQGGVPEPKELKDFLDQYVISQNRAKKVLSVAVHNHYKRIQAPPARDVTLEKSNILMIGPTGSGKTLLAQSLARTLDVPFTIVDATSLTEAGYVGEDVENIIVSLLQAADMDVDKCERGIIYVDEIDKLSRKSENPSITRDVSGEGVQQALLKIIEGTVAHIPPKGGRKHPQQELLKVDTSNILFICGGAFSGLEDIVRQRVGRRKLGFSGSVEKAAVDLHDEANILKYLEPEDLLKFGLIPELVGRLPVNTTLQELDEEALVRVLVEPKNALIRQYEKLFEMDGISLSFEEDALFEIARQARLQKCGARGLRSILEKAMIAIMYDAPDDPDITEIVVTEDVIRDGAEPRINRQPQVESA